MNSSNSKKLFFEKNFSFKDFANGTLSKKQGIESPDYELTDVYENDPLLDHLVKLETLYIGEAAEDKELRSEERRVG